MSEKTKPAIKESGSGGALSLWVGILLPPVAWGVQLQTIYLTSEYGCLTADFVWNHVASVAALLLALAGGVLAFRLWRASGGGSEVEDGTPLSRARFMSILGIFSGVLFSLVIFAQWLPTLMGVPCSK
jgi:hypothetical protein